MISLIMVSKLEVLMSIFSPSFTSFFFAIFGSSSNRRVVTKMKIFVIKCEFDILLRLVTEIVKRELREFDRDEHSGLY